MLWPDLLSHQVRNQSESHRPVALQTDPRQQRVLRIKPRGQTQLFSLTHKWHSTPSGMMLRTMSACASLPLARSMVSNSLFASCDLQLRLFRPVTKIRVSIPAAIASSAAYWIKGLSTIGSNSFGIALVAGESGCQNQQRERQLFGLSHSNCFCYIW